MKRILLTIILVCMICFIPLPGKTYGSDRNKILDPNEFSRLFFEKLTEGFNRKELQELVRRSEHQVFIVVMAYAHRGLLSISQGNEKAGKTYLKMAGLISEIYALEFKKRTLFDSVTIYENYNQEIAIEWLKACQLSREAFSLFDKNQLKKSLDKITNALEIYLKTEDPSGITEAVMVLGKIYCELGEYETALQRAHSSLEFSRELGDWRTEASNLINLGCIHYLLARYADALSYFQQAEEIYKEVTDISGELSALLNIGNVYLRLGRNKEALRLYQHSLEISQRKGYAKIEAKSLANIGTAYLSLGNLFDSVKAYGRAQEISRKINDVASEALILMNVGSIYVLLDKHTQALENFKRSLELFRKIGDQRREAAALVNIGTIYIELSQFEDAMGPIHNSIRLSEQLGWLEAVWRGYKALGEVLWKSGNAEKAVPYYTTAVETIEEIYSHTSGLKEEERSSMIGKRSHVYQDFIELLLELHQKSPGKGYDRQAFTISEKAKSRIFLELMAKAGARTVFAGDETFQKIIEREQQLIAEVSSLRTLLTKELSNPKKGRNEEVVRSIKEQLAKAERSLRKYEKEIDVKYPRYADLKRPKPLGVEELQDILKPDEILLSYSVGNDKCAAFVIGRNRFKLLELEVGRAELVKLIKQFRKGLDNVSDYIDLTQFDPNIAHTLYEKIFQPLVNELSGVTLLYITADDILYTLPFEALVDHAVDRQAFEEAREKGKKGQAAYLGEYETLHYLSDAYCITYLPSASVLRSLRQYPKPGYGQWTKPLIAFADPIFSPEEREQADKQEIKEKGIQAKGISKETVLTAQILTRSTGSNRLKRLEASAEEAKAVAKEVKGKVKDIYLREQATEENVHHAELKVARYLLFSTHGLLGGEFIGGVAEPALALTLVGNPPGRDGFLTMSEVLGLNLNAEVVMLSACNTYGRGEMAGSGEGFAGLTRSFMYAGTQSLLVTHWSVESQAARDLMVEAFRVRKERSRLDEALRKAKLQMRKSTFAPIKDIPNWKVSRAHPYFWAPFVVVGERK